MDGQQRLSVGQKKIQKDKSAEENPEAEFWLFRIDSLDPDNDSDEICYFVYDDSKLHCEFRKNAEEYDQNRPKIYLESQTHLERSPKVYVNFEYSLVETVMDQKIPLYCDYMDQGFTNPWLCEGEGYPEFGDFFDNDDIASLWEDEELYIKKEDYDRICQELEEE